MYYLIDFDRDLFDIEPYMKPFDTLVEVKDYCHFLKETYQCEVLVDLVLCSIYVGDQMWTH